MTKSVQQWAKGGSSHIVVGGDPSAPGRVRVSCSSDFSKALLVFHKDEIVEFARAVLAEYGPAK